VVMVTYVIAGPKRWIMLWLCRSIQCYNRTIIPLVAVTIRTCTLHFVVFNFPDLWVLMQTFSLCHIL